MEAYSTIARHDCVTQARVARRRCRTRATPHRRTRRRHLVDQHGLSSSRLRTAGVSCRPYAHPTRRPDDRADHRLRRPSSSSSGDWRGIRSRCRRSCRQLRRRIESEREKTHHHMMERLAKETRIDIQGLFDEARRRGAAKRRYITPGARAAGGPGAGRGAGAEGAVSQGALGVPGELRRRAAAAAALPPQLKFRRPSTRPPPRRGATATRSSAAPIPTAAPGRPRPTWPTTAMPGSGSIPSSLYATPATATTPSRAKRFRT